MRGAKIHLDEAEDLYRRAVKGNPDFVEARVHRGFVLSLLGQHRNAAEELRLAASTAAGPQLRYYAELFLGQAEESLGNRVTARDQVHEGVGALPPAQSPLLALAMVARQLGDRASAQNAMRQVLALPQDRPIEHDPWWRYYRWQQTNFTARFAELHALLREGLGKNSDAGPARAVSICPRLGFVCPACGQMESASVTHVLRPAGGG